MSRVLHVGWMTSLLIALFSLTHCSQEPVGTEKKTETLSEQGVEKHSEVASEPNTESVIDAGERGVERGPQDDTPPGPERAPEFDGPAPDEQTGPKKFTFVVKAKAEDVVPPRLISLTFSNDIKAGGLLGVYVKVGADLSGVVGAQVSIESPGGHHSMYLTTTYHPSHKQFEGLHRVPSYVEGGKWKISRVNLLDGAGNPAIYLNDQAPIKGMTVEIKAGTVDIVPPVLQSAGVADKKVKAGDVVRVWVKATDGLSPIDRVTIQLASASGVSAQGDAFYHTIHQRYEAMITIPNYAGTESWSIQSVDLADVAENSMSVGASDPLLQNKTFDVEKGTTTPPNPGADKVPPQLHAAWLAPGEVADGEVVRLLVKVSDADSGVVWGQAVINDAFGAGRLYFNLWHNPARGLWEGVSKIPLYSRGGVWSLQSLSFRDASGNTLQIDGKNLQNVPYLTQQERDAWKEHLHFMVTQGQGLDRERPVVKGFHLAPGKVDAGKMVRVYTRLEDPGGSGIQFASCSFQGPTPNAKKSTSLQYNTDTGFYEGNLSFSDTDPPGEWWVSGCYLQDKAGLSNSMSSSALATLPALNIASATSQASQDPFVVVLNNKQGGPSETAPPVMKGTHFSADTVDAGKSLRLFVGVEDVGSGVAKVSCELKAEHVVGAARGSVDVDLAFNPATSLWEGEVVLPADAAGGQWLLSTCAYQDKAGNEGQSDSLVIGALPALQITHVTSLATEHRGFQVNPTPAPSDTTAPTHGLVNLFPRKVDAGQSIRVYAKADDNIGITEAFCALKPPLSEGEYASYGSAVLQYNPVSQLFEGNYKVPSQSLTGGWSVARCQFGDAAGNSSSIRENDLLTLQPLDISAILTRKLSKQILLKILQGAPVPPGDNEAPSLVSLKWLPTAKVSAGKSVLLQAEATDKGDGVGSLSVALSSPSGQYRSVELSYNSATKRWEASVSFAVDAENGSWKIQSAEVLDKARNQSVYQLGAVGSEMLDAPLEVSGGTPSTDTKAPVFASLKRGQGTVLAGDSVRLYAEVSDVGSGVASVSVLLVSPSQKYRMFANLKYNPATNKWEGEGTIGKFSENGVWKGASATASDRAGNQVQLGDSDSLVKGLQVTVRGATTQPDTEAPVMTQLMVFPAQARAGEQVRLYAEISDNDSGVSQASIQLKGPGTADLLWASLSYNPATKRFEGILRIPATSTVGDWKVSRVELSDVAGNTRTLTSADPLLK